MSVYHVIGVTLLSCFIAISMADDSGVDHLEHLLTYLNKGYKRFVAPRNVTVSFGINYLCAILDERSEVLTSRVFERYKWFDQRLTWDPSKYGGIELIHVPSDHVWLPDNMRAVNTVGEILERDDITVVVEHDGHALWLPLAVYKTFCSRSSSYRTDHAYHCAIEFGPWSQGLPSLPTKLLFSSGVEIDDSLFHDQCPYVIGEHRTEFTEVNYDCCPGPFHVLSFQFDVHRRGYDKGKKSEKKELSKDCTWPHCP